MQLKNKAAFFTKIWYQLHDPRLQIMLKFMSFVGILFFCLDSLADSGTDLLAGTDSSFWATLNGTGKKYIYAAEGIAALGGYIKSKNLLILAGILVVSVFINIILTFAGQSTT